MRAAITALALVSALTSVIASALDPDDFTLTDGMRAVIVSAHYTLSVGATAGPGDRVDILATYQDPRTHQELTMMILQNILVLAVNEGETGPSDKKVTSSSMTLAVPPEQTELIAMADRAGALRISLRPGENKKTFEADQEPLQHRALAYLIERYPNIEPSHFVYLSMMLPDSAGRNIEIATVIFGEKDILQYSATDPKRVTTIYRTQYLVRLKLDGELVDIQRQERDDGVLIISPAPDRMILPPARIPLVVPTNTIIIIPPDRVPQTVP